MTSLPCLPAMHGHWLKKSKAACLSADVSAVGAVPGRKRCVQGFSHLQQGKTDLHAPQHWADMTCTQTQLQYAADAQHER